MVQYHYKARSFARSVSSRRQGDAMIRLIGTCSALLGAVITGAGSMGTSSAAPADIPADREDFPSCIFRLSPPQRTQLGSDAIVTMATIQPVSCSGSVQPTRSTVCLVSDQTAGSCGMAYAWNIAQVLSPSSPAGVKITTTGRGCWSGYRAEDFGCTSMGPITASV